MSLLKSLIVTICLYTLCAKGETTDVNATTVVPDPTPSPDFDCPDMEDNYYPHQSDCTKYYHCTNGLAWLQQCSAGLYFNPATKMCDWPWNVDCEHDGGSTVDPAVLGASIIMPAPWYDCPEENGAYPHDTDCDKYYDCYNGEAHLGICTDNMLFDLTYDGCNYAQDVYCDTLTRPTNVPTTTRRTTTTTRAPGASTEEPFLCPEPDGLFPDPANCGKYYQCHAGTSWHMECSFQLLFNERLTVCDHPANVDCGDRPIIPIG